MPLQNIYDDPVFFEGYSRIRGQEVNANVLFEQPALMSLLPDLHGKTVLDLGCGMGGHCAEYVRRGAERVVGIDISEKMLEAARQKNADPRIEYLLMPMEEIGRLNGGFDVVTSSLALHYVEDFKGLTSSVHRLLKAGGVFVFSQEHPLSTCFSGGERWTRDAEGRKLYANISNYSVDGERESTWFVDGVKKYHRTFSSIINTLVDAGLTVTRILEPIPDAAMLARYPEERDSLHKPLFMLVRAERPLAERIIAACGNDCSACPRYTAHPYEKTEEELRHTAELWMRIGYRDHVATNQEISCSGCRPENWCRYRVVKCCEDRGIKTCAECAEYPCGNMRECFQVTMSFEPACRAACTEEEYERLRKAFFEKEKNLNSLRGRRG